MFPPSPSPVPIFPGVLRTKLDEVDQMSLNVYLRWSCGCGHGGNKLPVIK